MLLKHIPSISETFNYCLFVHLGFDFVSVFAKHPFVSRESDIYLQEA